jgi:stromal membrane-associated protein
LHNFSAPANQPYFCKWSQEDTREFVGQLNIKVVKGTQLAVRDMLTSDPYVVLTLGEQV